MADMTGIEGDHRPIKESAPVRRRSPDHIQMFMRKRQQMQVADKFIERHRLSEKKKLFLGLSDGYLKIPLEGSVLDCPFHPAFCLPMLNALFRDRRAKALSIPEQVNGFEKVCLPLTIQAGKQIGVSGGANLQLLNVPIVVKAEFCEFHA
jgi:hypothetical protein